MPDKLARITGALGALEGRLDPQVLSKANPTAEWLLEARAYVSSQGAALFKQAMEEGHDDEWLKDQLAMALATRWTGHPTYEAAYCAEYLVDEYNQLGEGIHLVDKKTGRVTITLTDDDIYQPADVPREGGGMATPLKRIRPDLEAAITTWTFERAREEKIVALLAARGHQTTLLKEEGDPRLLVATRKGRSEIVRSLTDHSPKALLDHCGGTSGAFLRYFDIMVDAEPPAEDKPLTGPLEGHVAAQSMMGIQDQTTVNLSHSRQQTLRGSMPQGWVREIARHLAEYVHKDRWLEGTGEPMGEWVRDHLDMADFWVAPPELVSPLKRMKPQLTIIPVDRALVIGFLKPKVGAIVVPETFGAESHEMFERWIAVANLDYRLWFDPKAITCLAISNIEYQATVVT